AEDEGVEERRSQPRPAPGQMVLRAAGPRKRLPRRAVTGLWPGGAGPGGGDGLRRLAGSCAVGALVRRRALGGAVGTVRRRGLRIGGLPLFVPELGVLRRFAHAPQCAGKRGRAVTRRRSGAGPWGSRPAPDRTCPGPAGAPGRPQRFPRRACSRSIASNSALKLPLPKPSEPCRSIISQNTVGRSWTGLVKICSR